MPILHGHGLSPYVRKVRMVLAIKGIQYQHNEISPFEVGEEYRKRIHPMGKIPAYEEDGWILPDSSAICTYIDSTSPIPALISGNARDKAQIMWWEEYLDTALMQQVAGPFFFEKVIKPKFFRQKTDENLLKYIAMNVADKVLDVLERQLLKHKYIATHHMSLADVTFAAHCRAAQLGGFKIDESKFPKLHQLNQDLLALEGISEVIRDESRYLS